MEMGASASKHRPGLVVTLDALGTLYKFREPIATQYIKVARDCGLKAPLDEKTLMNAFKTSFKEISSEYPNYGKGQLDSPRRWWKSLVNDTFRRIVDEDEVPAMLADELYTRFSSNAAYDFYPDVKPFFEIMRQLKDDYARPEDPAVFVGVISNGDPRVKPILQSLGLRVGWDYMPTVENFRDRVDRIGGDYYNIADDITQSPWFAAYNPLHDIDMLVTSYGVGVEKPASLPFLQAEALAKMNYASKLEQTRKDWSPSMDLVKHKRHVARETARFGPIKCIHIGDDYNKDYCGAIDAGFEALHLARDGEQDPGPEGTNVVTDLEEAAMAIRILAAESLRSGDRNT